MKKDLSTESLWAVKSAAERILDHYGKEPADAGHIEYQANNLTFFQHGEEIWVVFDGNEVFHIYSRSSDQQYLYYPGDWIDEVERLDHTISHKG